MRTKVVVAVRDGEVQYVEVSDENVDVYVLNFDTQGAADQRTGRCSH
jgi:hypothetical protein